ncbi:hypothetical protein ACJIZ3_003568 [Penstemon smallii]|uniref:Nephrocystin-3 n=1 Tax=Penstemon smallii TaxID=265156 RepID=A0ABD3UB40_9LAMI
MFELYFRISQMDLNNQLNHFQLQQRCMYCCADISVWFPKCSVSRRRFVRSFPIACSLEVSGVHGQRRVTSSLSGPTNSERSNIFDDNSMNPSASSTNDLERQLEDFFNEIKVMIKMGKEDDAVNLLKANYVAIKEQVDSGAHGIEEAAVLDVIALGYMALGDLRAVGSLMDMLYKIVNGIKDEELLLDSILMHMGSMYAKLEKYETSISFYRRSLKIMEGKYGNKSSLLCTPLLGLAKVLGTSGKATEAIETYQRVITQSEYSRAGEGEELVVPLCALGDLLMKEGRASDAEKPFTRVLDIYTRSYGEKDGRVGMAMCSLAKVKCAKGNVNEAIDLYKKAIQILEESKYVALDDKVMEKMRIDLAELLHVVGRGEEGRTLLEECLLISEKFNGKDHPNLVPHLANLATSYSRSKNFVEAERLLRKSLQIVMETMPPDDPSITFPMLHLAVVLYNLHHDEEAERLALDVLRIREKAFGKESLPVGEALDCLVSIQSRLEKDDTELVELLKKILKIQDKSFGPESEEVMETLKKIVHYLDKMGMKNEKYPFQRRLSVLKNKRKQMVMY